MNKAASVKEINAIDLRNNLSNFCFIVLGVKLLRMRLFYSLLDHDQSIVPVLIVKVPDPGDYKPSVAATLLH